jgi:undecaprenyl-diphosphatase
MWRLVKLGSRRGESLPSRAGDVLRQPLSWVAFATVISLTGARGRRAALRGAACSTVSVLIHLPIKRAIRRPRPRRLGSMGLGSLTSSFPSGHTAWDLSFMFGAAQELPGLVIPLSMATLGSHWSLIRGRKHYPTDVVGGGVIAAAVAGAAWKLCPPVRADEARQDGAYRQAGRRSSGLRRRRSVDLRGGRSAADRASEGASH